MWWKLILSVGACFAAISWGGLLPAAELVVPAPPKTPEEEREALHVPPGFEVQLVASAPELHKPIKIAFVYRVPLWVTAIVEYPFPAPERARTRDSD